jgi:fatty-acyl-CoA synthase
MSPAVTLLRTEDALRKQGSVGQALACVEIRVVNDDDQDVPIGEVGEAIYRGPNVMKGYYKNPGATEEAMRGGWFHSGDLIRQDEEGYFYVVDRKKDMIISGGENIYSREIEDVIIKHPAVHEVAVIGVPDEKWGEAVKAFVSLREGQKASAGEIIDFCKSQLASFKKPQSVEFIESIPKNAYGKVLKRELREKYWKGESRAVR